MEKIRQRLVHRRNRRRGAGGLEDMDHRRAEFWRGNEYCFTTGQFARLDKSYRRHCGPTAVTNLIFTLSKAEGRPVQETPEQVFRRVAGIGGKRLIYMNADFLRRFGGTSDILAPLFISNCLREYGLRDYRVRGPFPANADRICTELDKGAILYMEVHHHPVYGNHHMLCYGYRVASGRLMLRTADGWITRLHDLPAGEALFALCTVISRRNSRNWEP